MQQGIGNRRSYQVSNNDQNDNNHHYIMKTQKYSMKKILSLTAALLLAGAGAASATQLVRELWDNCQPGGGSVPLVQVSTGTSSVGFTPAGSWYVSPVGQNAICFANNFDITDWELTSYGGNPNPLEAGAPAPYFGQGALYDNVGNLATFDTTNANDIWLSTSWAARPLTSGIDFASGNTYYFTVRMAKNYSYDTGGLETDNATMIGFSDGNSSTSDFFSVGFTREAVVDGGAIGYWSLDGTTDYGDSLFISYGTLGQPGYPNHNGANNSFDSGGPYYVQAVGPLQELDFPSDPFGTFVVGQIVTTLGGGPATISAKVELPGSSLDVTVPGSWDVTAIYTPANTNQVLNNLLLGMYGAFPGEHIQRMLPGHNLIMSEPPSNWRQLRKPAKTPVILFQTNLGTAMVITTMAPLPINGGGMARPLSPTPEILPALKPRP